MITTKIKEETRLVSLIGKHKQETWTAPDVTTGIAWILQIGVLLSAALIVTGTALLLTQPKALAPEHLFIFPRTLSQVASGLLILNPQAIILSGCLLLIATPILRVAASVIIFALERDRRYVLITLTVLAMLLFSLFLSETGPKVAADPAGQLPFSLGTMLFIFGGSFLAGTIGALVGLGGGIMIVPMLTLVFKLPIDFAIGVSIISVIATSSGAAAAYVRDRLTNIRVGMFLEIATTIGALSGALLASLLAPTLLGIIFGLVLLISAAPLIFKLGEELPRNVTNDRLAKLFRLSSSYPDHCLRREVSYQVTRTPSGFAMMYLAGVISGLLGIGSGTFKVVAMDTLMKLPLKVSSATSNLMIGVTAAASASIYFSRGDIPPLVAAPVALGVLLGAFLGARLLMHMSNRILRLIFVPVVVVAALEMILHSLGIGPF
jgi:uncharacterized membrane protein YfcA/uncharacterized membrane protein